ncbi:MAG: hypothetical protein ACYCZR_05045 [Burkholderiales bacterium]
MSEQTKVTYSGEYLYPGSFFAEETHRTLTDGTFAAALEAAPDGDGWFAVKVRRITQKRFVADDGEEAWITQSSEVVGNWIIGRRIHADDIEPTQTNSILISNIRCNSKDGYGVKTRCGNWQIASDYTEVIDPASMASKEK